MNEEGSPFGVISTTVEPLCNGHFEAIESVLYTEVSFI